MPCSLSSPMDPRSQWFAVYSVFLFCKDGSDDFQVLCMSELKPEVAHAFLKKNVYNNYYNVSVMFSVWARMQRVKLKCPLDHKS